MTERFKVNYTNLVFLTAKLKQATNEENINKLSKLISSSYKEMLHQTSDEAELTQLHKLRPIIIDVYNKKQSEVKTYHLNLNKIEEDSKIISSETAQLFHEFLHPEPNQINLNSNKKNYELEDITKQIDEIFNTDSCLNPDGTINSTTKKILLQRIYDLVKTTSINSEAVQLLVTRVMSGKKETVVIPDKIEESRVVNGIEITPSISGVCEEDQKRLEDGINQLFQP